MQKTIKSNKRINSAFLSFLLSFLSAFIIFIPFVIMDKGYFTYYADFDAQQIPFYIIAHDAIRNGNIGWNWLTDLGSDFVGSYSFYLLGSPFFWITIPFPSECVPYLIAPLLCLKFGFMGLGSNLYLNRFTQSNYAIIGSLLYAFCGFSMINMVYNHFYEPMLYLPFVLWALEKRITENKRGVFALFVCLSAICNYFFFIGECVFLLLYWLFRILSKTISVNKQMIFGTVIEAILGTFCSAVILIPSFLALLGNNRASELIFGQNALYYKDGWLYLDILHSLFFPPDRAGNPNFFSDDIWMAWSQPTLWLPLFGSVGTIDYMLNKKCSDWISKLIVTLFVIAIIPLFNSLFYLFNSTYYSRWYYMFTLMLVLATIKALEDTSDIMKSSWKKSTIINLVMISGLALLCFLLPSKDFQGVIQLGRSQNKFLFYVIVFVALMCLGAVYKLMKERETQKEQFIKYTVAFILVIVIPLNWYTIYSGRMVPDAHSSTEDFVIDKAINGKKNMPILESKDLFYRIDTEECLDNLGMYWQTPSIRTFHSIVPSSILDFYESIGVDRYMKTTLDSTNYKIRSFLSVKYDFDYYYYVHDSNNECKMNGWNQIEDNNGFQTYENSNFVSMGFSYDSYITESEYYSISSNMDREAAHLKYLIIEDQSEKEVEKVLSHANVSELENNYETFVKDCANRNNQSVNSFEIDSKGFKASIECKNDNYVLFTVPYDKGWSAKVNGKDVEINKTNIGFMSVLCDKGNNEIAFTYKTPGLTFGIYGSIIGVVLLFIWIIIEKKIWNRN